ncbi:MAG: nuclear transport factor 2 family protein [Candidatus Krumholzibacteria bacterium]|nr:nuclear transport factor 2 family protein [Candidatus Krumholzibacteria bacterium]
MSTPGNPTTPTTATESTAAEIRALVASFADVARRFDLDRLADYYAADVRAFDAINQLEFRGRDVYLRHWADCLAQCNGPMIFETDHLEIESAGDLAVAHCLTRCGGVDDQGQEHTSWMRATIVFRKLAGRWQTVHEHFSLPVDMETGQMLGGLKP